MILRKITIDSRVRYVNKEELAHSEQAPHISKEKNNKPNARREKASNSKLSQNKIFRIYSYED